MRGTQLPEAHQMLGPRLREAFGDQMLGACVGEQKAAVRQQHQQRLRQGAE
ncbi:MAG: hypothetical protein JF607_25230 [Burkholderiales bacterium]|nr:hypothetical protein [Burkholderiales bacterium]